MLEPDVTLTDYVLGLESVIFCVLLYRTATRHVPLRRMLVGFFAALALGSFIGGTVHGYFPRGHPLNEILWHTTMLAIGIVASCSWLITGYLLFPRWRWLLAILAPLEFLLYAFYVLRVNDTFRIAILNYAPATIALLIAITILYKREHDRVLLSGIFGILLTFAAAGIQQSPLALGPYLDHNALYHILQGIALYMIFLAFRELLTSNCVRHTQTSTNPFSNAP